MWVRGHNFGDTILNQFSRSIIKILQNNFRHKTSRFLRHGVPQSVSLNIFQTSFISTGYLFKDSIFSYLAENALRLQSDDQPISTVQGHNRCLSWQSCERKIFSVGLSRPCCSSIRYCQGKNEHSSCAVVLLKSTERGRQVASEETLQTYFREAETQDTLIQVYRNTP
jgi:hypothetical protein